MLDLTDVKHLTQQLGNLDTRCTYQYRTALLYHVLDLVDNGIVFLALGAVNTVVHIITSNRFIGRDNNYIQFVDIPELACFRLGRTGHTGKLMIHTEIVLQRDGCESLRCAFHFHVLFCFNCLMQTV